MTILTILGQLRTEVVAHEELRDQVRVLLAKDPRYQVIQMERRKRNTGVCYVI